MIYFILCAEARAVKIGITLNDPYGRLSVTQTHCPLRLELLGAQDGHRQEEIALHQRFAPHHIQGEWFRFTDELREHCATLQMPPQRIRVGHTKNRKVRVWSETHSPERASALSAPVARAVLPHEPPAPPQLALE